MLGVDFLGFQCQFHCFIRKIIITNYYYGPLHSNNRTMIRLIAVLMSIAGQANCYIVEPMAITVAIKLEYYCCPGSSVILKHMENSEYFDICG